MADLTGQPYFLPDRQSSDTAAAVAEISTALHDTTLDDVPDIATRPLPELTSGAALAHAYVDDAGYGIAGRGLADLLIELAGIAAQRGLAAARLAERPDLVAMVEMSRTSALIGLGARRRAAAVCEAALQEISALRGPIPTDTTVAEACGMLHLTTALIAARDGRMGDSATHFAEAQSLAAHTGERNHMRYHFGPTNVAAWELGLAVEAGTGPDAAERFMTAPIDLSVFSGKGRTAYVHFDLARAWAQAEGPRDQEALRALDAADRLAPVRLRNDPIARDLVLTLGQRSPRPVWELDSLRNRFGLSKVNTM
ncbi:MAG: hypothetical protein ACRDTC_28435 [Pseudonocardiaceae bacterium]